MPTNEEVPRWTVEHGDTHDVMPPDHDDEPPEVDAVLTAEYRPEDPTFGDATDEELAAKFMPKIHGHKIIGES
jgi:hypothetical protein